MIVPIISETNNAKIKNIYNTLQSLLLEFYFLMHMKYTCFLRLSNFAKLPRDRSTH